MTDPEHNHPQSQDIDSSVHGNSAPVQRVDNHDHGSKATAQMALIFAVSAVVVSLVLMLFCYGLWNRYDLLKINYNDLKAAMLLHGVNPHPHFPAESP